MPVFFILKTVTRWSSCQYQMLFFWKQPPGGAIDNASNFHSKNCHQVELLSIPDVVLLKTATRWSYCQCQYFLFSKPSPGGAIVNTRCCPSANSRQVELLTMPVVFILKTVTRWSYCQYSDCHSVNFRQVVLQSLPVIVLLKTANRWSFSEYQWLSFWKLSPGGVSVDMSTCPLKDCHQSNSKKSNKMSFLTWVILKRHSILSADLQIAPHLLAWHLLKRHTCQWGRVIEANQRDKKQWRKRHAEEIHNFTYLSPCMPQ